MFSTSQVIRRESPGEPGGRAGGIDLGAQGRVGTVFGEVTIAERWVVEPDAGPPGQRVAGCGTCADARNSQRVTKERPARHTPRRRPANSVDGVCWDVTAP
jgi:hypothetical protein